jgi:hypothetical protein
MTNLSAGRGSDLTPMILYQLCVGRSSLAPADIYMDFSYKRHSKIGKNFIKNIKTSRKHFRTVLRELSVFNIKSASDIDGPKNVNYL